MKIAKGMYISTPKGRARVVDIDWLSEQIMVLLDNEDWVTNYNFSEIEDIHVKDDEDIDIRELNFG